MNSDSLVPGDIIRIPENMQMPCDAILIEGGCIMDENYLTGECVTATKSAIWISQDRYKEKRDAARHTLLCGTKVVQLKGQPE